MTEPETLSFHVLPLPSSPDNKAEQSSSRESAFGSECRRLSCRSPPDTRRRRKNGEIGERPCDVRRRLSVLVDYGPRPRLDRSPSGREGRALSFFPFIIIGLSLHLLQLHFLGNPSIWRVPSGSILFSFLLELGLSGN